MSYIAPPSPTTGVVITATLSGTSPAVTGVADTAIVAASLADGNYVFSLAGEDTNSNYYVAGVITVAGGLITGGEQSFSDIVHDKFDAINGTTNGGTGLSIIAPTTDGNLLITLVTCTGATCPAAPDPSWAYKARETLNGLILPLSTTGKAQITEYDAFASASGLLEPQVSSAFTQGTAPGPASFRPQRLRPGWCVRLSGGDRRHPQRRRCGRHRDNLGNWQHLRRKRCRQSFPESDPG